MMNDTKYPKYRHLITETSLERKLLSKILLFLATVALGKGYKTVISFSAFFHGGGRKYDKRSRPLPNITSVRQFSDNLYDGEFDRLAKYMVRAGELPPEVIELDSFEDFLKVIGYDRKTRKYSSGETLKRFNYETHRFEK